MFWNKKPPRPSFDTTGKYPVIRSSICTGEQVAGFKDRETGKFTEIMLIRGDSDVSEFCRQYGVNASEIKREY